MLDVPILERIQAIADQAAAKHKTLTPEQEAEFFQSLLQRAYGRGYGLMISGR